MERRCRVVACSALLLLAGCAASPPPDSICGTTFQGRTPLQWAVHIADAEMDSKGGTPEHQPGQRGRLGKGTDYANAFWAMALLRLTVATGDERYRRYAQAIVSEVVDSAGGDGHGPVPALIGFNQMLTGRVLIDAMEHDADARLVQAAHRFRRALDALPRTNEGVYAYHPGNIIADGLYMTLPFQAQYALRFGRGEDRDDVVRQLRVSQQRLFDPVVGLPRHGWDETGHERWADPRSGRSPGFWGRGAGWYMMTVSDTLDYLPFGYDRERAQLVQQLRTLTAALPRWQHPRSGLWHHVPDKPGHAGNVLETSSTAMFTYVLAKGINRGHLEAGLRRTTHAAYAGLLRHRLQVDASGRPHLLYGSNVASLGKVPGQPDPQVYRDGSWTYYMSEGFSADNPHVIPAFVIASIEMDRLVQTSGCQPR